MRISIIIPTYNEEACIATTIEQLRKRAHRPGNLEVIIADGGSKDRTIAIAEQAAAEIVQASKARRSVQLNKGAAAATGAIFYFLHADTIPPLHFDKHIRESIKEGTPAGCFRLSFNHSHFLLWFYARWTWLDIDAFRYGDQSLFIPAKIFKSIGGYRGDYYHMEDYEIVRRIKKSGHKFALLPFEVTTSARKYLRNGFVRLQVLFVLIYLLYKTGVSQEKIRSFYKKWVH